MWPFKKKEPLRREIQVKTAVVNFQTLDDERFQSHIITPANYIYAGSKEKGPCLGSIENAIESFLEEFEEQGFYRVGNIVYPKERIRIGEITVRMEARTFEWNDGGWHRVYERED